MGELQEAFLCRRLGRRRNMRRILFNAFAEYAFLASVAKEVGSSEFDTARMSNSERETSA
jgi:hypothetical protein